MLTAHNHSSNMDSNGLLRHSNEELTKRSIACYENAISRYVEPRNDTWFWFFSWR